MSDLRFSRSEFFVSREIAGEAMLVPIRSRIVDLSSLYILNETGAMVWSLCNGERTLAEILDVICGEYEVSREEAEHDLEELVEQLRSIGGLEQV
jgi:hypothetical protein